MRSPGFFHRPPRMPIDKLADVSWTLVLVLCLLAAVGVAALYSVAGGAWAPWAERHAVRFLASLALLIAVSVAPLELWRRLAYPAYLVALAALALVPIVGSEALGARRWLSLGSLGFQPSELMKVALVLALARYYQDLGPSRVSHPVWVALPLAAILIPMALVARQPDLGTAVLLGLMGLGVMLLAGVNLLYFAGGAAALLAAAPYAIAHLHDYQRRRLETFLDPSLDPLGAGYHITQSKIALGSGGISGKGFLGGTQSQLDFLPEKHTDFIFTTIAEEWGFVGAFAVLALIGLLVAVVMGLALTAAGRFARLLAAGVAWMIFCCAAINVGMVTGLLPVVGVPLPFISYGGTSMVTLMLALGLAMCGHVHRKETRAQIGPLRS